MDATTLVDDHDTAVDDGLPISRFAWIARPAPKAVVQKAYAAGLKAGLPDDMALALAEAAVDPGQLRSELNSPRKRHVDGCEITYVTVDVWSLAVVPSLENIRFEHERGHWRADPTRPLLPRFGSASDAAALTLQADSPERVADVLAPLVTTALETNSQVRTVPLRGVEEPVMLAFARVGFRDQPGVTILEPVDGFCRTAQTHATLGATIPDVLVRYNRTPTERVARIKAVLEDGRSAEPSPEDTPTLAQAKRDARARLRCLVLQQAAVIIGFDGPGAVTFDQARRRLVGRLHLSPPMAFTAEATYGAKARAAIDALSDSGKLPTASGLTPQQVAYALLGDAATKVPEHGRPNLRSDEIAALALRAMRPRGTAAARAIEFAIRDLTGQRPGAAEYQQIAAEIALRAAPDVIGTVALRAALARSWQIGAFSDVGWSLTQRSIPDLLAAAELELERLRRDTTSVGPAIAELGVLASWHLVTSAPYPLARSGFGTKRSAARAGEKDNREPNTLLRTMMLDPHGVQQLAQVIYDGRAGRPLTRLENGSAAVDAPRPHATELTEPELRAAVNTGKRDGSSTAAGNHRTPEDDWADAQKSVQNTAAGIDRAMKTLMTVRMADGRTFASTHGYKDEDVSRQVEAVRKALNGLEFTFDNWLAAQTGVDMFDTDENGADELADGDR